VVKINPAAFDIGGWKKYHKWVDADCKAKGSVLHILGGSARSTLGARVLDKLIDWRSLFRFGASFEGKTTGEK